MNPKTRRQKRFFQEVLTADSFADAARKAGYSVKSARVSAHRNITRYNGFFISLFQDAEIDITTLAANLKQGLNSQDEQIRFRYTKLALEMAEKVLRQEDENGFKHPASNSSDELSEEEERDLEAALEELQIET